MLIVCGEEEDVKAFTIKVKGNPPSKALLLECLKTILESVYSVGPGHNTVASIFSQMIADGEVFLKNKKNPKKKPTDMDKIMAQCKVIVEVCL